MLRQLRRAYRDAGELQRTGAACLLRHVCLAWRRRGRRFSFARGGQLGRPRRRPRPRLHRVASHADLARASTACASFRRLIADPSFQRRHRHPPLLLGFLGAGGVGFQPVEAPHPNAPVARSFGNAAGFSFDYIPNSSELGWGPCDVSHGRVLLQASPVHGNDADSFALPDLAVCNPLFRQYLLLPRIHEDLLAYVQIEERNIYYFDESLPSGDWEETSFRVLRTIESRTGLVVCVFSSTSGCWSVGASTSWVVLSFNIPPRQPMLETPQFAYSCCYWKIRDLNKLLKLDMDTMEFSSIDLQPELYNQSIAIVEAGGGNLGMFTPRLYVYSGL
uniref:F-box domain-containing protein n=1 Tax=Setaria viridis TaxID=4556 RepID=A0A4U6VYS0_SETVI|nr:hypothetical protein SEVIR_2G355800v2 [Setaria viridis]